jgi:hypothetical protein
MDWCGQPFRDYRPRAEQRLPRRTGFEAQKAVFEPDGREVSPGKRARIAEEHGTRIVRHELERARAIAGPVICRENMDLHHATIASQRRTAIYF